jgi:RNA polymerase sigma factor (sigma-70 family)
MAMKMNDMLARAVRGDYNAILLLIEHDEEILYRIAFTYLKNEQDTLDVMQELTYKALKKMHTVKQPEYARTWLVRVLINCCHDLLKRNVKTIELNASHISDTPHYNELTTLLNELSLSEQQLIYAKYFQQLKNNEIAAIHNIPEGTVKSRIHSILKKLRKAAGVKEDWL